MKVNIFDFDGTIYDGDSSIDFFKFCLKKNKKCFIIIPNLLLNYFLYFIKIKTKTQVKEVFFSFLKYFSKPEKLIKEFWNLHDYKIKKFYLNRKHDKDIIISASPEFLISHIAKKLKVKDLIASDVEINTGKFLSSNCKGEEKVTRLKNKYNNIIIVATYTDSYSDKPLIDLSEKAYFVKKNKIICIK